MFTIYKTDEFDQWLSALADLRAVARISQRIRRAETGNLGTWRSLGGGVSEMKIDHGPGYRLYFTRRDRTLIVLLVGGDKSSQRQDVARAKAVAAQLGGGRFHDS